jgi:hypothetical protein
MALALQKSHLQLTGCDKYKRTTLKVIWATLFYPIDPLQITGLICLKLKANVSKNVPSQKKTYITATHVLLKYIINLFGMFVDTVYL